MSTIVNNAAPSIHAPVGGTTDAFNAFKAEGNIATASYTVDQPITAMDIEPNPYALCDTTGGHPPSACRAPVKTGTLRRASARGSLTARAAYAIASAETRRHADEYIRLASLSMLAAVAATTPVEGGVVDSSGVQPTIYDTAKPIAERA